MTLQIFKIIKNIFASTIVALTLFSPIISNAQNASTQNLAQVASSNADFSTLVAALTKADLVPTFTNDAKYTVLAPNNAAFAKIPATTLNSLLAPENKDTLVKILKYHVVTGEAKAAQIINLSEVATLEGNKIKINVVDGKVSLNGASTVTATDTLASNGVIHTIDTVLIPADVNLNALVASTTSNLPTTEDTVRTGGIETMSLLALVINFVLILIALNTVISIKLDR
jgi:transforming growth factor-beta-induced protein